jgi:hypothetical protein
MPIIATQINAAAFMFFILFITPGDAPAVRLFGSAITASRRGAVDLNPESW